jgi:arsenical pump membrane protein
MSAGLTTVVLNLDTTVVVLTPLCLRLAHRTRSDPVAVVAIPLLLASLASSVLPIPHLTTLIVTDRFHVGLGAVVAHLALLCVAARTGGRRAKRRHCPTRRAGGSDDRPDRHVLVVGGLVVAGLLVGFVIGPSCGVAPWMTAAAADVALIALTRVLPRRDLPVPTAAGVAALAALTAVVVPSDTVTGVLGHNRPIALVGVVVGAAGVANLPAVLHALDGVHRMSWGLVGRGSSA